MPLRLFRLRRAAAPDPHSPWSPELEPLARQLVILRAKAPFLKWCRGCSSGTKITLDEMRADAIGYLVPGIEPEDAKAFVEENYGRFFAEELSSWTVDPEVWPQERSLQLFHQWFDVEVIDMVFDVAAET